MRSTPGTLYRMFMAIFLASLVGCGAQATQSPQAATTTTTIGIVSLVDLGDVVNGFKEGLNELGYVEGQNVTYIYDGPTGTPDGLAPAIQRLIEADVDLIYALTTPAALVAKELTANTDIPVVFAPLTDPVGAGIVESLAQPGGNLTGVTTGGSEGRRLEWLQRIAPHVKQPFLPYNPNDPAALSALGSMQAAAAKLNLELVTYPVSDTAQLEELLANVPQDIDSIILLPDSLVTGRVDDFVQIANERKIPMTVSNSVDQGALMAFGANFNAVGKQSARLADKIVKGTKPAEVPVETAEFFLQINTRAADTIDLDVSDDILRQASTVVR